MKELVLVTADPEGSLASCERCCFGDGVYRCTRPEGSAMPRCDWDTYYVWEEKEDVW